MLEDALQGNEYLVNNTYGAADIAVSKLTGCNAMCSAVAYCPPLC